MGGESCALFFTVKDPTRGLDTFVFNEQLSRFQVLEDPATGQHSSILAGFFPGIPRIGSGIAIGLEENILGVIGLPLMLDHYGWYFFRGRIILDPGHNGNCLDTPHALRRWIYHRHFLRSLG